MKSGSFLLKSQIRLAEKRGLLSGQINLLQEEALAWLLIDDAELDARKERERMKYTILAANPHMYKALYEDEDEDGDIPRDQDIEWITPKSVEELQEVQSLLSGIGNEEFNAPSEWEPQKDQ